MAKYATTEELFECWVCQTQCAQREMWATEKRPSVLRCPSCGDNIIIITQAGVIERAVTYYDAREFGVHAPPDWDWAR